MNFSNQLNYAEHKKFRIFIDVYQINEGDNFDKIYEALSELKNKQLKINIIPIEKYKDMKETPDFEQDCCSISAIGKKNWT